MKTYEQRISASQEDKNLQEIQFRVTEAKLQLQQDILVTGRALAAAQRRLETAKSAYPFNSTELVEANDQVKGYYEGLSILQAAEAELFGSGTEAKSVASETVSVTPVVPVKKSKAKTEAGKARAAAAGLKVDDQE